MLGSLTDEMEGLVSLNFCGPQAKTYAYKFLTKNEYEELNQSSEFVKQNGLISFTKKQNKKIEMGAKVMAKGFVQKESTKDVLNFEKLCDLVEGNLPEIIVFSLL